MSKLDIIKTNNVVVRLTVNSERITIKLIPELDGDSLIEKLHRIGNLIQSDKRITCTLRGSVEGDIIVMKNDSEKFSVTYSLETLSEIE